MRPADEPFRSVRSEELRRLEMCERALADAYREQALACEGADALMLARFAAACDHHAQLLGARVEALGGMRDPAADPSWLIGSLAVAEHTALATYHDHLGDHDAETIALVRDRILPDHRAQLAWLERDSPVAQPSEL